MQFGSFGAAGLVLFSLLGLTLAIIGGARPETIPVLFVLIGLPALAGTLLAWLSLRKLRTQPNHRLSGKLALLAAVAWPLLVLDVVTLLVLVLGIKGVFMAVFHGRAPGFLETVAVFGSLFILGLDCYVVWRWLARWESKRTLPGAEFFALLRAVPRRAIWVSGAALVVLVSIIGTPWHHRGLIAQ